MGHKARICAKAGTFNAVLAFCLLGFVLSGCQSAMQLDAKSIEVNPLPPEEIILTAPVAELSDYDQLMVFRLSELLENRVVNSEERARLYYELGIVYDRMGLESSARVMFMNALAEKADFAPAYDFMGVYLASQGMFQDAYEAFDSALELAHLQNQKRIFTYFSRAIALYYGLRPQNALDDIVIDYTERKGDPYRMLWCYIIGVAAEGEELSLTKLAHRAAEADEEQRISFGMRIVEYYLGKLSKTELLDLVRDPKLTMQERIERACEAYFYLGKLSQIKGDDRSAFWYYHLCAATAKYDFLEHRYARVEIARLAGKYQLAPYLIQTVMNAPGEYEGE